MSRTIETHPLTSSAFAAFGDVLEASGDPDKIINQGKCGRFHDKANLDFSDGQAGISIFKAEARSLPFTLEMMERHPEGSQAFVPMHQNEWLVVVAADNNGSPATPQAFIVAAGQAINLHRNTWHCVLCPLHDPGLFAVVDRIGLGDNLVEHWFDQTWQIIQSNP